MPWSTKIIIAKIPLLPLNNTATMSIPTTTTNKIQKGLISSVAMYEQALLKEHDFRDCDSTSTSSSEESQIKNKTKSTEIATSKLLKKYATILKRLEKVKIHDSVFVHCSLLFKKVMSKRKSSLQAKDVLKIYTTCIFISFKFIVDDLLFYAKDFSALTGMDQKMLEMLECAILVNILSFKLNFSREEFIEEARNLELVSSTF